MGLKVKGSSLRKIVMAGEKRGWVGKEKLIQMIAT